MANEATSNHNAPQPRSSASGRSLAQSYAALPASTRLRISLGICAVGLTGIIVSDYLEKRIPAAPSHATTTDSSH